MTIIDALQKTLGFGVEDFVKKAIEGRWKFQKTSEVYQAQEWLQSLDERYIAKRYPSFILLDPAAWQAVGKVEVAESLKEKHETHPDGWTWCGWCGRNRALTDLITRLQANK